MFAVVTFAEMSVVDYERLKQLIPGVKYLETFKVGKDWNDTYQIIDNIVHFAEYKEGLKDWQVVEPAPDMIMLEGRNIVIDLGKLKETGFSSQFQVIRFISGVGCVL